MDWDFDFEDFEDFVENGQEVCQCGLAIFAAIACIIKLFK